MRTFKLGILILAFLLPVSQSIAQYNTGLSYSNHFKNQASVYQPSLLGQSYESGYVSMPYFYAYVGNSSFDLGTLNNNLGTDEERVDRLYERSLNQLGEQQDRHLIGFGMDVQTMFFSYKLGTDDTEWVTFSLGSRDRVSGNFVFSRNFYKLMRRGNKQFEGETVQLDPLQFSMMYSREYSLGLARGFDLPFGENFSIRPGIQGRYIRGFANLQLEPASITMHTHDGGRAIDLDMNYTLNTAHPVMPTEDNFPVPWLIQEGNPLTANSQGRGYGIDAGFTANLGKYFKFSSAVTDIGEVNFNKNTSNFSHEGQHTYDGYDVDITRFARGQENWFEEDFSEEVLRYEETNNSYKQSLGTKLILEGEVNLIERESSTHNEDYTQSNFYVTFIRGFEDQLNATTRPYYSVGYMHDFWTVFNLSVSYGFGGYNRSMIGSFASLRAGVFRIGAGSNNINALFDSSSATGADFSFVLSGGF